LSVVRRFARENTNELGETINVAVGAMIVLEFKKFFYLCTLELHERTDDPLRTSTYVEAPFPCPPLIEKLWDLLILYTDFYQQLCT